MSWLGLPSAHCYLINPTESGSSSSTLCDEYQSVIVPCGTVIVLSVLPPYLYIFMWLAAAEALAPRPALRRVVVVIAARSRARIILYIFVAFCRDLFYVRFYVICRTCDLFYVICRTCGDPPKPMIRILPPPST